MSAWVRAAVPTAATGLLHTSGRGSWRMALSWAAMPRGCGLPAVMSVTRRRPSSVGYSRIDLKLIVHVMLQVMRRARGWGTRRGWVASSKCNRPAWSATLLVSMTWNIRGCCTAGCWRGCPCCACCGAPTTVVCAAGRQSPSQKHSWAGTPLLPALSPGGAGLGGKAPQGPWRGASSTAGQALAAVAAACSAEASWSGRATACSSCSSRGAQPRMNCWS
ncbi:hypothetical protein V8C86DRAFT_2531725 [Haematococcus lacustris]